MPPVLERSLTRVAFDPELSRDKMIFIAGPRQAGKTTLARAWLEQHHCSTLYFNWDDPQVRARWRRDPHFFEADARTAGIHPPWIAFDEVHRTTRWRDLLKIPIA